MTHDNKSLSYSLRAAYVTVHRQLISGGQGAAQLLFKSFSRPPFGIRINFATAFF